MFYYLIFSSMDSDIFIFSIDGVYTKEDNLVVSGRLKNGELKQGEEVHLVARFCEPKVVTCVHIIKNEREIVRARKGDGIEIVLSGVAESDVKRGMYLSTPNYRVRFD